VFHGDLERIPVHPNGPETAINLLEHGALGTAKQLLTVKEHSRNCRRDLGGKPIRLHTRLRIAGTRDHLHTIGFSIEQLNLLAERTRGLLLRAVREQDPGVLKGVKGVGRKTAEKLLLELRSLLEHKPGLLGGTEDGDLPHEFDSDAIAALTTLGFDPSSAIAALKRLPPALRSTEERVAAALRSL